ncbi:MAG TPA: alanine--tRNA ligase, partial [Actinotalea sp.]
MRTAEIRRRWLDYFEQREHAVVPSSSLISPDPSTLFVIAGMVPFIPYMLGQQTPPWQRATSVQKCVRTLDIDEVGKTTRHGTFFQMNGNFSFGDYFKEGAITYAWELVTGSQADGCYGFDPDKIWVTVYHDDDEAAALWKRIAGLPEERIQRRGKKDNYWTTGQPGPAGPCSEIYVDRGPEFGADGGPVVDEDRFLEIWNLVFMQYEIDSVQSKDDFRIIGDLKQKNIDTGMGLERVAYLLQGVDNLYEIDEVFPVITAAQEIAGKRYGANHDDDVRMRVVADHIRSSLMLIGDGITPSNEGRGYVLRRLLRRSVRAMKLLGVDEPALPYLLPASRDAMGQSYPELIRGFDRISRIAYAEEEAFRRTLVSGTTILDTAVRQIKGSGGTTLPGAQAFALHDTYGFPIDLTLEMAGEQGLAVDEAGFRSLMQTQRERARADAKAKKGGQAGTTAYRALRDQGATEFTGYAELNTPSTVRGLLRDGEPVDVAAEGQTVELVLDRTPFYAESGGQDSDSGVITSDGARLEVLDVQRPVKGLIVHTARVVEGELASGSTVLAQVDPEWRLGARQAHSGTHVVHAALREVLGPEALQSGSYNKPGYLRLDFSWNHALSAATRSEIEEVSNRAIRQDLGVKWQYMTLPEARAWGAIALFGETYDEQVRVVEIGGPWSRELCGGTHVDHSSQIGLIALTGESSVGSGSRRVEALVGIEGFRHLARERALVSTLTEALKVRPEELPERVASVVARLREAEKELATLRQGRLLAAA